MFYYVFNRTFVHFWLIYTEYELMCYYRGLESIKEIEHGKKRKTKST